MNKIQKRVLIEKRVPSIGGSWIPYKEGVVTDETVSRYKVRAGMFYHVWTLKSGANTRCSLIK